MMVFAQEWWVQEWHVWAGLALGVLGLVVGSLSWWNAQRAKGEAGAANTTAKEVSNSLDKFKVGLKEELDQRRAMVSTEPVVPEPANFMYISLGRGGIRFANAGPGTAHDVQVAPANNATTVSGIARARVLTPKGHIDCAVSYDNGMDLYATVRVTWVLHAGGDRESQTFQIPEALPILG